MAKNWQPDSGYVKNDHMRDLYESGDWEEQDEDGGLCDLITYHVELVGLSTDEGNSDSGLLAEIARNLPKAYAMYDNELGAETECLAAACHLVDEALELLQTAEKLVLNELRRKLT